MNSSSLFLLLGCGWWGQGKNTFTHVFTYAHEVFCRLAVSRASFVFLRPGPTSRPSSSGIAPQLPRGILALVVAPVFGDALDGVQKVLVVRGLRLLRLARALRMVGHFKATWSRRGCRVVPALRSHANGLESAPGQAPLNLLPATGGSQEVNHNTSFGKSSVRLLPEDCRCFLWTLL